MLPACLLTLLYTRGELIQILFFVSSLFRLSGRDPFVWSPQHSYSLNAISCWRSLLFQQCCVPQANVSSSTNWAVSKIDSESSHAEVGGVVTSLSSIKSNRKNADVCYFEGKLCDGEKSDTCSSFQQPSVCQNSSCKRYSRHYILV